MPTKQTEKPTAKRWGAMLVATQKVLEPRIEHKTDSRSLILVTWL